MSRYNPKVSAELAEIAGNTFEGIMCIADKYGVDREELYNHWISTFIMTVQIATCDGYDDYVTQKQMKK